MYRRTFLQRVAAATAAMTFSGCSALQAKKKKNDPNIVILYADDLGYGDLSIQNGCSKIMTPHLDQLAREGLRCRDAHSSSGVCSPSRYGLLTGRYHWRKFFNVVTSFGPSKFSKDRLTLPEMLKTCGYRTACIGKWHLGWDWDAIRRDPSQKDWDRSNAGSEDFDWSKRIPDGPCDHGFDYYFGKDAPNQPPYTWIENDRVVTAPTCSFKPDRIPSEGAIKCDAGPMAKGWHQDEVMPMLTKKAVEWIEKQRDKDRPFFLYFPWTSPHTPIIPKKEFHGTTQAGDYGDYVHQSDWSAGQVLKALDDNGFRENTIVIFTSDNGPEKYAYDRVRNYGHRSMGPLRGVKCDTWEGGHRVPFIVRWPGVVKPNTVSDDLVSQVDLMATFASIVNYKLPDNAAEDSYDQLRLFRGETLKSPVRSTIVHNTRSNGKYAIRQGDWVYFNSRSGRERKPPQWYDKYQGYERNPLETALYNLRVDLAERINVVEEYPQKAAELAKLLVRIRKQGYSAPRLTGQP